MWQGTAHVLAPLTKMCGSKEKVEWSTETQEAFKLVKN